jgi:hypothetical protein
MDRKIIVKNTEISPGWLSKIVLKVKSASPKYLRKLFCLGSFSTKLAFSFIFRCYNVNVIHVLLGNFRAVEKASPLTPQCCAGRGVVVEISAFYTPNPLSRIFKNIILNEYLVTR